MRNIVQDRKVESRSVNAGLTARDNLLESSQLVAHGFITIKVELDKPFQLTNFFLLSIRSDSISRIRQPVVGGGKVWLQGRRRLTAPWGVARDWPRFANAL